MYGDDGGLLCISAAKPGKCPVPLRRIGVLCRWKPVDECTSDAHCDGKLKCCFNGCSRTCQKPGIVLICYLLHVIS